MLIRGSPNGLRHSHPQLVAIPGMGGRDPSERVVVFNRNEWSRSIGIAGRDQPVRAAESAGGSSAPRCQGPANTGKACARTGGTWRRPLPAHGTPGQTGSCLCTGDCHVRRNIRSRRQGGSVPKGRCRIRRPGQNGPRPIPCLVLPSHRRGLSRPVPAGTVGIAAGASHRSGHGRRHAQPRAAAQPHRLDQKSHQQPLSEAGKAIPQMWGMDLNFHDPRSMERDSLLSGRAPAAPHAPRSSGRPTPGISLEDVSAPCARSH